ncbi:MULTISPECIES: site-2 protease family protein [Thermodesulfovibrio]|uniref:Metalloprotease n=1 Tax=Thermodesulfovibrio yellowstonii (strain ATCC 51303 / DSM 11347 / YP87) TaxID=289376 RepID=B5YKD0_THEYD|nr:MULTISPECIES: site-2 protease family protein [Thermodesulfovibrio]ACI20314.1 metalloprotease [Thermodesulfovibrio yellowstonii DSM 11347]
MKKYLIPLILFIMTIFTTLFAGALQQGINLFKEPMRLWEGYPFSISIMTILLGHEMGHYFASKAHRTKATLPYFIPAPSIIGTFGAFIKMKSPILTRKALIDIGATGPIVGFILSLIACIIGLKMSKIIPLTYGEDMFMLGDSILFSLLVKFTLGNIPAGQDVLLHSVAFAGWIGLFVTSMNLLPVGQLDGGHIAYALFGKWHFYISRTMLFFIAALGVFYWYGWLVWALLLVFLGVDHPPILVWESRLSLSRRIVGILSFIIFLLTFTPTPFNF